MIVHLILDNSGSMYATRQDTIGGVNGYVRGLLTDAVDAEKSKLTVTRFDRTNAVVQPLTLLRNFTPLTEANYPAQGMSTSLYDAVGDFTDRVQLLDDGTEPQLLVIITDGEENSSTRHTRESVIRAIDALKAKGNWTVAFIGANIDVWAAGKAIGATSSLSYVADSAGTANMYGQLLRSTVNYSSVVGGAAPAAGAVTNFFQVDDDTEALTSNPNLAGPKGKLP